MSRLFPVALLSALAAVAAAQSDLSVSNLKFVGPDGVTYPKANDGAFGVSFNWTAPSSSAAYKVKVQVGAQSTTIDANGAPDVYAAIRLFANSSANAGPVTCTVTLDPDKKVNDPDRSNNVATITMTPDPASTDLILTDFWVKGADGSDTPTVGDRAIVGFAWNAPSNTGAYRAKVQFGDQTGYVDVPAGSGSYEYRMAFPVTRATLTTCSVTIDSTNVVSDPDRTNNGANLSFTPAQPADSDLNLTSVKAVGPDGTSAPVLGDAVYGLRFQWTVPKASKPYRIKVQMGDQVAYSDMFDGKVGTFEQIYNFTMPLDGAIPAIVTLDPDAVANDPSRSNNVASTTFTPIAPSKVVDFYNATVLTATETMDLTFSSVSKLKQLVTLFGAPATATSQVVTSVTPVSGSTSVTTSPSSQPAYQTNKTSGFTTALSQKLAFTVQASNARMNAGLVNDTWTSVTNATSAASMQPYVKAETLLQKDDSKIKAFVTASLPTNYKTTMTPLATARKLYQAVLAKLTYTAPWTGTAVDALVGGQGDCGAFSELYVASLRAVGIPARVVYGWLKGTDQTHAWTEMYLPSAGWIPQDPTYGNDLSETGEYAYYFGVMPDLNARVSVSRATVNNTSLVSVASGLQKPLYYFWMKSGSAPTIKSTVHTTLQ